MSTATDLDELEQRAGASDQDREAWLAERRDGITATEVRDLYMKKKSSAKLIAQKLGWEPEPDLGYLRRVRYGRERETAIGDTLLMRHGFEPEHRVFRHTDNPRHLASPDGLRADFDGRIEVAEIKTAEDDLAPDSDEFKATGYPVQGQWLMYVLGPDVRQCLFAVEACVTLPDGRFEPGELRLFYIERDDALIGELVELADEFLAVMDDMRENGIDPVGVALLEDALATTEAQKRAREALERYCAETGVSSVRIPEGSLSYSTPAPRTSFDQGAFKDAHPGMYQEFTKQAAASKPTLRVTPRRAKKEEEA